MENTRTPSKGERTWVFMSFESKKNCNYEITNHFQQFSVQITMRTIMSCWAIGSDFFFVGFFGNRESKLFLIIYKWIVMRKKHINKKKSANHMSVRSSRTVGYLSLSKHAVFKNLLWWMESWWTTSVLVQIVARSA